MMEQCLRVLILLAVLFCPAMSNPSQGKKPANIVFILTDDQDVVGAIDHIEKTKKYIANEGITFTNMFTSSPLCSPSRASILTGKYVHNHKVFNNSVSGGANDEFWQETMEPLAFPANLKWKNYTTFFAGKYMNEVSGPYYYNITLSVNGKPEMHGDKYPDDYLTDIIGKRAMEFIRNQSPEGDPFFAMLSTPAAHAPFTPAPQYQKNFSDLMAPRRPSFDVHGSDKHWLMRHATTPMDEWTVKELDNNYRQRLRALLSVDDIVENVVKLLEEKGLLENTYVIYTSDNGYHLGQFSLPCDKRQLYDFDIHVPLFVRGPGIDSGQTMEEIIVNIDFAPTFLDIAGLEASYMYAMDGRSMLPLLHSQPTQWRDDFLVEHNGEDEPCPFSCSDSKNNTYSCVRTISPTEDLVYCMFEDDDDFEEYYDLSNDPDQLHNIASQLHNSVRQAQKQRLHQLVSCFGNSCQDRK